jgi:hypothetical protein
VADQSEPPSRSLRGTVEPLQLAVATPFATTSRASGYRTLDVGSARPHADPPSRERFRAVERSQAKGAAALIKPAGEEVLENGRSLWRRIPRRDRHHSRILSSGVARTASAVPVAAEIRVRSGRSWNSIKATAMLDDNQKGIVRMLIYPVQFDENPTDGVDRVLKYVIRAKGTNISPGGYLAAIQAGLQSDECLSDLVPQKHTESSIRTYIAEIQGRLKNA